MPRMSKPPAPLEKEIERKIRLYAESRGCDFEKFVSPGRRGVSDRLVTAPGGAVGFLEVKRGGKEPTKLQYLRMQHRKDMGCVAEWCDNVLDGKLFVDELVAEGQKRKTEKEFWG